MTLGGANVWTNFSYGYRNESPSGWLLSQDRSRLILFKAICFISYSFILLAITNMVLHLVLQFGPAPWSCTPNY